VSAILLLLGLVLAPWPFGCAPDSWRYALTALLLVAAALWHLDAARRGRGPAPLLLAAGGAMLVGGLQIVLGTSVAPVWSAEATLIWVAMLAVLAVLAETCRDRRSALRVAGLLLVAVGSQAVFGVIQAAAAPGTVYGIAPSAAVSPLGSYVNHNHFAGLVEMAVPLALGWALGLWRRARGPTPGALGMIGLALGLSAAHLASRSRGGLVALVVGTVSLAAIWWMRHQRVSGRRRLRAVAALALVAALVLAFGWLSVPSTTRRHLGTVVRGTGEAAAAYRLEIARATLRLAAIHPILGCGLGAFADAVTPFKTAYGDLRVTHAEDDVLQLVAEAGLVGLVALLGLVLALGRRCARSLRERGDPVRRGITLGALSGVVALLVHSFLDFNLHLPANALAFVVLLALAASPAAATQRARLAPPWRVLGAAVVAALLLLAASAGAWRTAGAVALDRAMHVGGPRERIAALGRVTRCHPYLSEAYQLRARVRMQVVAGGGHAAGQLARARRDVDAAIRLRPAWGAAWADRAWLLWAEGDLQGAGQALDRALVLDPSNRDVRAMEESLRARSGA